MATKRKPAKKKTASKKKPARKPAKKKVTKKKAAPKKKTATKKKTAAKKPAKRKTASKKKAAPKKKTTKKAASKKKTTAKKKPTKKASKAKTSAKKAAPKKKSGPTPPRKPSLVTPKNSDTKQYTQSEFFDCLQGYCGFDSRKEAKEFYTQFTAAVQSALKNGYKIPLPGLGKMQVRRTKARMGRNPMTQEPIKIPARKKVAFTANKALKDAVL